MFSIEVVLTLEVALIFGFNLFSFLIIVSIFKRIKNYNLGIETNKNNIENSYDRLHEHLFHKLTTDPIIH